MTTPKPDELADLRDRDVAALQLAIDLTLADDPPDSGRVEQVQDFLRERSWRDVAEFCSYHQQMHRLSLHCAMSPPCWIRSEDEAHQILHEGFIPAANDPSIDVSNCASAKLLLRMLRAGVSAFHPNPVAAVEAARKRPRD